MRDVRDLALPGGTFQLKFMDIAASINPATVHIRSLNDPALLSVLEQNYEYDLLDPAKLLAKYVGREVTLLRPGATNGTGRTGRSEGHADRRQQRAGVEDRQRDRHRASIPASIRFPELPDNLYDRPTLLWTLDNRGAQKQKVEASYLAGKLSWSADYVLERQSRRDRGRSRRLGDAREQQRHGIQERATATRGRRTEPRATQAQAKALEIMAQNGRRGRASAPFQQEAFSEYHLYTLGRRTSVMNNETKQISLLNASGIPR